MTQYRQFTDQELQWIRSFERVMKKAPDSLFLFVGVDIAVYSKDENNQRYVTSAGAIDDNAPNVTILSSIEYDGGDY